MTRCRLMMLAFSFALSLSTLNSQLSTAVEPEVDTAAVLRRGDLVTRPGNGIEAQDDDLFGEAIETPADDSGKWFITVITSRNCAPCERLKKDFASAAELRAFADPSDREHSWAHLGFYTHGDFTQDKRWVKIKIGGYPTIIVQPPRNKQFGEPATVVKQLTGYDGNAKQLAATLSAAIREYVKTLPPQAPIRAAKLGAADRPVLKGFGQRTVPPPFTPVPRVDAPAVAPANVFPFEFPPAKTLGATLDELKAALPEATSDFLLGLLGRKATLDEARQAWQSEATKRQSEAQAAAANKLAVETAAQAAEHKTILERLAARVEALTDKIREGAPAPAGEPSPSTNAPTKEPTAPPLDQVTHVILLWVTGGGISLAGIAILTGGGIWIVLWIRKRRIAAGQTPAIPEAVATMLQRFEERLIAFGENRQPPANP